MSSWTRMIAMARDEADEDIARFRKTRDTKLVEYSQGRGPIGHDLTFIATRSMRLLQARPPEFVREELRSLAPTAHRAAEHMFGVQFQPDDDLTTNVLAAASGVCAYECFGLDVGDTLAIFKPHLVRVETSPRMEYPYEHWNRGLIALALDDRRTWGPIAGFMPNDAIPFQPGATFEFNMQGFLAHLAGAIVHHRPATDVMPAWRNFMRSYPTLQRAKLAFLSTLLWAARLVHHHLAGQPLGTVADFLHAEIQAAVAAEAGAP